MAILNEIDFVFWWWKIMSDPENVTKGVTRDHLKVSSQEWPKNSQTEKYMGMYQNDLQTEVQQAQQWLWMGSPRI